MTVRVMTERHETARRRRAARRMFVGAFACVCFALQQFLVPWHLALNDHVSSSGPEEHVHSHRDHSHGGGDQHHGHESSRDADSNEDHKPHPVDEHLAQIAEPGVLPTLVYTAIAPAPAEHWQMAFDLPVREQHQYVECGPRPPPPRTAAAPRAPPIVV